MAAAALFEGLYLHGRVLSDFMIGSITQALHNLILNQAARYAVRMLAISGLWRILTSLDLTFKCSVVPIVCSLVKMSIPPPSVTSEEGNHFLATVHNMFVEVDQVDDAGALYTSVSGHMLVEAFRTRILEFDMKNLRVVSDPLLHADTCVLRQRLQFLHVRLQKYPGSNQQKSVLELACSELQETCPALTPAALAVWYTSYMT